MTRRKLLLHTCCAPCVTVPIERLGPEYEITCFFYNPNIHPEDEFRRRLSALRNLANELKINLIVPEYRTDVWFELTRGLENEPERGIRCAICFEMRLQETARLAKEENFDLFTTTLTISPHKNSTLINQIGVELSQEFQIEFLEANFKKKDGYQRSLELSQHFNLYRQNYCGCIFSRKSSPTLSHD